MKHEILILAKHQTVKDHALLVLTADYGLLPELQYSHLDKFLLQ